MHSAEHILNQTMVRMFDCGRCVSAHIEKKKSRIDYRFNRDLMKGEIMEIERRINEIVSADYKVTEEFIARSEAQKEFNLNKLPQKAGESIRIINIGNYDICPCSGPHIASTREIGKFHVISTSYSSGILRLRFKLST